MVECVFFTTHPLLYGTCTYACTYVTRISYTRYLADKLSFAHTYIHIPAYLYLCFGIRCAVLTRWVTFVPISAKICSASLFQTNHVLNPLVREKVECKSSRCCSLDARHAYTKEKCKRSVSRNLFFYSIRLNKMKRDFFFLSSRFCYGKRKTETYLPSEQEGRKRPSPVIPRRGIIRDRYCALFRLWDRLAGRTSKAVLGDDSTPLIINNVAVTV